MTQSKHIIILVVAAIVAAILQLAVAPYIAINQAFPNFLAITAITSTIARAGKSTLVYSFVLGLLYSLVTTSPFGVMSALLVAISYLLSKMFSVLNNETLLMPFISISLSCLALEILLVFALVAYGSSLSLFEAIVFRALPCALYDAVVGIALYPLLGRLFAVKQDNRDVSSVVLR